ncbi:MAG: shikimate kinase [Thermoplasmata archaeon]|nr:shikimate kinase [Thermoplasmata archaeon]
MTSLGRSNGSITVINAMPTGIGATIGVALETRAEFSETGSDRMVDIRSDGSEDTTMARICVRRAYEAAGIPEPECWSLATESDIPVSRGLKSSSSACNAIIRAVFDSVGFTMDEVDLIRLGVVCAREAKVTVTGSFDDACGCGLGGLVMTDNRRDEILARAPVEELDVVISVPRFKIRKGTLPVEKLRAAAGEMQAAIDIAMTDPFRAMTINGAIISGVQGVDNTVADRAMSMGALGAGLSGSGPAVAIVVPKGDGPSFARDMGLAPEETILTRTRCEQ